MTEQPVSETAGGDILGENKAIDLLERSHLSDILILCLNINRL